MDPDTQQLKTQRFSWKHSWVCCTNSEAHCCTACTPLLLRLLPHHQTDAHRTAAPQTATAHHCSSDCYTPLNAADSNRCRIIGLTLETRPNSIDVAEIGRLREFGTTRMHIGVQHTDDAILTKINRGCCNADGARAVRLLKDCAFKIDFHLMPDLPGSTPAKKSPNTWF